MPRERFYDVVIVGAGISGALVADALSGLALRILVVDRREPAAGSTAASTALVQWEIDQPLERLSCKVGSRRANACYRATYRAVSRLRRRIEASKLASDMVPRKTVLLAGTNMEGGALRTECARRRSIGLPSQFLDGTRLAARYGFDRDGAIVSAGSLEVDPRKLTLSLLRGAERKGVEIISQVEVIDIDACARGVFISLSNDRVIAADRIIVATGYEALPGLPDQEYELVSTWALATSPQADDALWKDRALIWEASDPYLYLRSTADNRIIAGGEDAAFANASRRDAMTGKKTKRILRKLGELLPGVRLTADYAWAGTFAQSPTGLPMIGEIASMPRVFAVLASGGNGITFSVIAAQLEHRAFNRAHILSA